MAGGQTALASADRVAPANEDCAVFIVSEAAVRRWMRDARPGDTFVYARIEHLPPRCPAARLLREQADAHKVTLQPQRRHADGTVSYSVRRKAPIRSTAPRAGRVMPASLAPDAVAVRRFLRGLALEGFACPTNTAVARQTGLRTADQARYAMRKLILAGEIVVTVIDRMTGARMITFKDGVTTARPPISGAASR
jgi:hypothetical protein